MHGRSALAAACLLGTLSFFLPVNAEREYPSASQPAPGQSYLGFDTNLYPGDEALPILRKTFSFAGYWLSPPPGQTANTWLGKRTSLHSAGFGFLVLYRGAESATLKTEDAAVQAGVLDASNAATSARREGFPSRTIVFLDIEQGGRLPPAYHAYLRAWVDELARAGYRAGVYCSGMPASEPRGVTIITADDIRNNIGSRAMAYWVYNDTCPPSPGCTASKTPPLPAASGIPYAAVWQMAQSPRRKSFTARCAAAYQLDGNCYALADTAHAWFLDINTATSPNPSR